MDDAYAYLLPRGDMPQEYYDGYYYACAMNFEYIPEPGYAVADKNTANRNHCAANSSSSELAIAPQLCHLQAHIRDSASQPILAP